MCRSTVDIQSATAENRRGKRKKKEKIKKKEEEIRKKPQLQNIMACPTWRPLENSAAY